MRLLAAGGGSGGHVTPVLAVINQLVKSDPSLRVTFICDRQFAPQARLILAESNAEVTVKAIYAGKFRRFHNVSFWRQLLSLEALKNLRDLFLVGLGFLQSWFIIIKFKPDLLFAKGGFVCLPVGWAARLNHLSIIIHDSDSKPGLTNRLLSPFASVIATGAPLENYNYPIAKSHWLGVPIGEEFKPVSRVEQQRIKTKLGIETSRPLVMVTGGGLGAAAINRLMALIAKELTKHATVLHISGTAHYQATQAATKRYKDYIVKDFITGLELYQSLAAADIVIARGGITFLTELAALEKAVILIPAPSLSDQQKTAAEYEAKKLAVVLDQSQLEADPNQLLKAINKLLADPVAAGHMAKRLRTNTKVNAAVKLAGLILTKVKK